MRIFGEINDSLYDVWTGHRFGLLVSKLFCQHRSGGAKPLLLFSLSSFVKIKYIIIRIRRDYKISYNNMPYPWYNRWYGAPWPLKGAMGAHTSCCTTMRFIVGSSLDFDIFSHIFSNLRSGVVFVLYFMNPYTLVPFTIPVLIPVNGSKVYWILFWDN